MTASLQLTLRIASNSWLVPLSNEVATSCFIKRAFCTSRRGWACPALVVCPWHGTRAGQAQPLRDMLRPRRAVHSTAEHPFDKSQQAALSCPGLIVLADGCRLLITNRTHASIKPCFAFRVDAGSGAGDADTQARAALRE